jgi:predicted permease
MNLDLGYKPESVITVDLSTWNFATNEEMCQLDRRIYARLSALPGVQAVGTSSSAPLTGKWTFNQKAEVVGQPLPEAERPSLAGTFVAFDYFQAMGTPLVDGRFFHRSELKDNGYGQNVILNEAAAEVLFPGRTAIGGRFTVGDDVLEVVGVVKDARDVRLETKSSPRLYRHYAAGGAQVVVRSTIPARALMPVLRDTIQQTDRRIIRQDLRPMTEIVSDSVAERRFLMAMLVTYAAVALGIATVGIFGVVSYQVAQRTNEFGVRLALGASPSGLIRLVVKQAGCIVGLGLVLGLVLSLASGRLLSSQLFGLSAHDPFLLATVSSGLLIIALLATVIPARRAAKVDPMEALRYE